MFGAENLHHSLNQSDAKLIKKNYYLVTRAFPCFSYFFLQVLIALLLKVFPFLLIDHCDCLRHSIEKHSYLMNAAYLWIFAPRSCIVQIKQCLVHVFF